MEELTVWSDNKWALEYVMDLNERLAVIIK